MPPPWANSPGRIPRRSSSPTIWRAASESENARLSGGGLADVGQIERQDVLAFITDAATETVLRDGLADLLPLPMDTRRGGVRAAGAALERVPSPRVLIVDVSGEEQPLTALGKLSEVVEPHVVVLVIARL